MGDRRADPTAQPLRQRVTVVRIDTLFGSTYHARAQDIEDARAKGQTNVPLCLADGSPIPTGSSDRNRLRLSTIEVADLTVLEPSPARAPSTNDHEKMTDEELIETAKLKVDLAGFLATHGWIAAPGDTRDWRKLAGPGGQQILVHRAEGTNHWTWYILPDKAQTGTIIDACQNLLGMTWGRTLGTLRKTLKTPPSALPLHHGGRPSAKVATFPPAGSRPARTLDPLGTVATEFLTTNRCLDPVTVEAFAHWLRADPDDGHLVCPHNEQGDGEEYIPLPDGSTRKRFTGAMRDGEGRGRSLWHAKPKDHEPIQVVVVNDTALDAVSAWQCLDPATQPETMVISTAGNFSAAGEKLLPLLIQQLHDERNRTGTVQGKLTLVDASDVGEAGTEEREGILQAIAAAMEMRYVRWEPTEGCKDWNEVVQAAKREQEAQEAAWQAESMAAYLAPKEDALEETQGGPPTRERSRHRR